MKFDIKRYIKKGQYAFKKNKGLIFTVAAGVCTVAAVVTMAKQAPKAEKVLVPANKKVKKLKEDMNNVEMINNKEIVPAEAKKEIRKIQMQTFGKLVKIYALPVIFTGLSLTFMGGSYKVMREKELALGAAYITVENAFKSYRNRVKDKFGEDTEKEIFNDIREVTRTRSTVNPDTGEVETVEETVKKAFAGGGYEVFFDAATPYWSKNGRTNYETLMQAQKELNIKLKADGYVFLYDVFDRLGIPEGTINKDLLAASRVIGWIYDPYDPKRSSWVSFGISDELGNYNAIGKELFDNTERDVLLTFNPDGNIISGENNFSFFTKK